MNVGRELNSTFIPSSLLRKGENKLVSSLTAKCRDALIQINFKKQQVILLS